MYKEWGNSDNYVEQLTLKAENGIVEISEENAAKAIALVRCNPTYAASYNSEIVGSSARLFKNYENLKENEKLSLVKAVNSENSTRLSNDQMSKISDNITKIKDFGSRLKEPGYSVFKEIYNDCTRKLKNKAEVPVYLMSYASKFCHFYCWHVLGHESAEKYPIIDTVMQEVIPIYYYLNKQDNTKDKSKYILWDCRNKSPKEINRIYTNTKLNCTGVELYYSEYVNALKCIKTNLNVSVTGIEHLLWYYHKDMEQGNRIKNEDLINSAKEYYKKLKEN